MDESEQMESPGGAEDKWEHQDQVRCWIRNITGHPEGRSSGTSEHLGQVEVQDKQVSRSGTSTEHLDDQLFRSSRTSSSSRKYRIKVEDTRRFRDQNIKFHQK
jgi:hypothetical protein